MTWRISSFSAQGNCVEVRFVTSWKKSNASAGNGQCVEVRHPEGVWQVRNSRKPLAEWLTFTEPEWAAFIKGVKAGEFDE